MSGSSPTQRAIAAVWKIESARLIAGLVRLVRDVGTAEEIAQDAFVAALAQWPESGIPQNPGAWLMATAKHRAIDRVRRDRRFRTIYADLTRAAESGGSEGGGSRAAEAKLDGAVEDDLLRLVFTACHPALSGDSRAAITLRLLCGLTTAEIARAFLVPETTIAQRIVRAKRTLSERRIPFEVPEGPELTERLASVLEVIYLLFNEGYAATAGSDWMRPALCDEALRLGRILAELMPGEPEVHGLVALMEIQASRNGARLDRLGRPILLLEQDRALWDQVLIRRGLAALARARALAAAPGPYMLQACIAACHARARTADATDWPEIVGHYERLFLVSPSPIVELNRAVAVAMAVGPQAGLNLVDALVAEPLLKGYHLLPAVRGDFLFKLGRHAEARGEFERAASLCQNERERGLLLERAAACRAAPPN
jgi:RNA polymerase sigma factor (sigma-70 family)